MKFLDKEGLTHWTSQLKSYINTKIEALKTLLSNDIKKKQDKLTAGSNITIDSNNNISATDTKYTHPSTHPASMITGLPTSLPANGGNASTVGGFTVGVNVPANAKFTDTTYTAGANITISNN